MKPILIHRNIIPKDNVNPHSVNYNTLLKEGSSLAIRCNLEKHSTALEYNLPINHVKCLTSQFLKALKMTCSP